MIGRSGGSANKWFYSGVKFVMEGCAMGVGKCVQKRAHRNYVDQSKLFSPFLF